MKKMRKGEVESGRRGDATIDGENMGKVVLFLAF